MVKKHENKKIGALGEDIAAKFLKNKGFEILDRNYKKNYGEIDIIAKKDGKTHFVEVKSVRCSLQENVTREKIDYRPEEMVHAGKIRKISTVATEYIIRKKIEGDFQVDVVAVFIDEKKRVGRCRFTENIS